jgi:hypothetical protein
MVTAVHPRSDVAVGATDSNSVSLHSVRLWHTGWEVDVAAIASKVVVVSQRLMLSHCRLEVLVAAAVSTWTALQTVRVPHALSEVAEAARVSYWVSGWQVLKGLHLRSPDTCQPDMYCMLALQTVKTVQPRSVDDVGAADSYCSEALHSRHVLHTGC